MTSPSAQDVKAFIVSALHQQLAAGGFDIQSGTGTAYLVTTDGAATDVRIVDLQSGAAQLAIRYGPGHYPGLNDIPLCPSRFAPVCAPE